MTRERLNWSPMSLKVAELLVAKSKDNLSSPALKEARFWRAAESGRGWAVWGRGDAVGEGALSEYQVREAGTGV